MKVIQLILENGDKWQIPLEHIAKNRTDYYQNNAKENGETDFNYKEEYDFAMEDDYAAEDWLKNNMNYEDFDSVIKIIKNAKYEEQDWMNADSEIIEVEE